jgi:membrane associated rhomboid family serine protease
MTDPTARRITPWVGRLLAINAVVLLLQQTVFTSDGLTQLLHFDPSLSFLHRPWTFFTYMFLHANLFHLIANSVGLFVFGPPVERRLGSRVFITFYVYCGVLAAVFSLLLQSVMPQPPFIGASGAILGLAFAFAKFNPDAELLIFPFPVPIKASRFIWILLALDIVGALVGRDNIAHLAHIGGFGAAWLYFAVQSLARPVETPRLPSFRPRATVAVSVDDAAGRQPARSRTPVQGTPSVSPVDLQAAEAMEVDRVLDKIHATGLSSLTADERRFLDNVAARRRDTPPKH